MAKVYLLLQCVMFLAGFLKSTHADCDQKKLATECTASVSSITGYCSATNTYIQCIEDKIINNPNCSDSFKQEFHGSFNLLKAQFGCNGTGGPAPGPCDLTHLEAECSLGVSPRGGDNCSYYNAYIQCLEDKIMNNPNCPDPIKQSFQQGKGQMLSSCTGVGDSHGDGCDGATLAAVCPAPGSTHNVDICSDVVSFYQCLEVHVVNSPNCSDVLKQTIQENMKQLNTQLAIYGCSTDNPTPTSTQTSTSCDMTALASCPAPVSSSGDFCSQYNTYFKCVEDKIINNPSCSDSVKQNVYQAMNQTNGQLITYGCSAGNSVSTTQSYCDLTTVRTCNIPINSSNIEYCSTYIRCVEDKTIYNPACSESVKQSFQTSIAQFKIMYNCSEFQGPQPSCDTTSFPDVCPAPYSTGDYCSDIDPYLKCLEDQFINNPSCSDAFKQAINQSINELKAFTKNIGCSTESPLLGCDVTSLSASCRALHSSVDYCRASNTYLACIEDKIIDNPDCPDDTKKTWIRNLDTLNSTLPHLGCGK